jgi:hypothetical protein
MTTPHLSKSPPTTFSSSIPLLNLLFCDVSRIVPSHSIISFRIQGLHGYDLVLWIILVMCGSRAALGLLRIRVDWCFCPCRRLLAVGIRGWGGLSGGSLVRFLGLLLFPPSQPTSSTTPLSPQSSTTTHQPTSTTPSSTHYPPPISPQSISTHGPNSSAKCA